MHKFSDIGCKIDWKCNWSFRAPIPHPSYCLPYKEIKMNRPSEILLNFNEGLFKYVLLEISTLARKGKVQYDEIELRLVDIKLFFRLWKKGLGRKRCRNILLWVSSRFPL